MPGTDHCSRTTPCMISIHALGSPGIPRATGRCRSAEVSGSTTSCPCLPLWGAHPTAIPPRSLYRAAVVTWLQVPLARPPRLVRVLQRPRQAPLGTRERSAACQVAAAGGNRVAFIERAPKRAYVIQYNLSVQREIAPNTTLMVGYVGSHGVHGTTQVDDVNEVLPTNIGGRYFWPCEPLNPGGANINDCGGHGSGTTINQSFGRLPATFFRNSSLYNGMQVQLTKVMSHGFQATAGFTWQKSIDTASGAVISDSVITAISTLNWFDPKLTRAVSDFNNSKVFTLNYLWDIPTPKSWSGFTRSAAGGWELGGIFSASSGEPFTPLLAGDVLGQNNTDSFAYPDRVPSCGNSLTNPETAIRWRMVYRI